MSNNTAQALHGTNPLTTEGDLAAQMVEVLDGYVSDAVADSLEKRETFWHRDYSSHEAYVESVKPNRERLRKQIGCLDERLPIEVLSYVATTKDAAQIAADENYTVSRVRWQVFDEVEGEGLLLEPMHNVPVIAHKCRAPRCRLDTGDGSRYNRRVASECTVCEAFSKSRMSCRRPTSYQPRRYLFR